MGAEGRPRRGPAQDGRLLPDEAVTEPSITTVLPALAFLLAAELSRSFVASVGGDVWPILAAPAGVLFGLLIGRDRRHWLLTGALGLGLVAMSIVVHGDPWRHTLLTSALGLAGALACALALERSVGASFTLTSVGHVLRFILLATLTSAAVGLVATLVHGVGDPFAGTWLMATMSQLTGLLLVSPGIVAVRQGPTSFSSRTPPSRRIEVALAMVVGIVTMQVIFGDIAPIVIRVPAYVLPFLLWIAFRGEAGDTVIMVGAIAVDAMWNSAHALGPYVAMWQDGNFGGWVLRVQGAGAVLASTVLLLSAVVAERKRAAIEHARLVSELQQALAEIKTLQGMIPICAWCHKIRNDAGSWQMLETYLHAHTDATFSHGICPECSARETPTKPAEITV